MQSALIKELEIQQKHKKQYYSHIYYLGLITLLIYHILVEFQLLKNHGDSILPSKGEKKTTAIYYQISRVCNIINFATQQINDDSLKLTLKQTLS